MGSVYLSTLAVTEKGEGAELTMAFECVPQSFGAKMMWVTMGFLFKGATKKALMQDLVDVKNVVERSG